ncbi:hypothetical protein [Companilactobacillus sp.]|uniref:hypothetical protein n=1 Tax=Companilactobacillus sp. TaxID=2767905 RepID=UPI002617F831|nr:hypothetical protein [Companilactobacillus sp.]
MDNKEYFTFPFEVGPLNGVKLRSISDSGMTYISDEGKVVSKLVVSGISPTKIEECAAKFGVTFADQILSIRVNNSELKMGKDKILQTILILATSR